MIAHRADGTSPDEIVGMGMRARQRPMAAHARAEVDARRRIQDGVARDLRVGGARGREGLQCQGMAPTRRVRLRGTYLPLELLWRAVSFRTSPVHHDVVEADFC